MNDESSPIMTIEEAADLLKIPVSSVYKLAQANKIPAQKVGRHWRFHRQTLIQWIANGQMNLDSSKVNPSKMDFS
jgi:excisionase family DNA binding protein